MIEIISALAVVASNMLNVGLPAYLPQVLQVDPAQLKRAACGDEKKCSSLVAYTDHTTGLIYIAKTGDPSAVQTQAALFRELARYILIQNRMYSPADSCEINSRKEIGLERMELQFVSYSIRAPATKAMLSTHLYACSQPKPDKSLKWS